MSDTSKFNKFSSNNYRPKKSNVRCRRVDVRMTEAERELIESQSKFYGMDISSYIRFLVELDAQRLSQVNVNNGVSNNNPINFH